MPATARDKLLPMEPHQATGARPPRKGCALALTGALLLLLGIGVGIAGIASGIAGGFGVISGMQRFTVPGEHTLEVAEPRRYRIYHETGAVDGGVAYWGSLPAELHLRLLDPEGEEVRLEPVTTSETYSSGSREGRALFAFNATRTGPHRLIASAPPGSPAAVLAVGRGMGSLVGWIFGGIGAAFFGTCLGTIGAVLLVIGLVRRLSAPRV
jgi:hypothetical protein